MTADPAHPVALRRKIESWLAEPESDTQPAIALRARYDARDQAVLTVDGATVRVVPCATPLAARAALTERRDDERLVLLTELSDNDLGDGLLAHVSRGTVRSIDRWDLVRQMFALNDLDPTLTDSRFGGGRWVADALTEYAPEHGWPPSPGAVLARDHALRCLTGELLGLDRDQLDSASLLHWSTDPESVLRFSRMPAGLLDGVTSFLTETAGTASIPIMAAVRAGHGAYAVPLGLLAAVLWPGNSGTNGAAPTAGTELVARTRLEPSLGGLHLTDVQARAFATAAEAWIDRAIDAGERGLVHRLFIRAEEIAAQIGATNLLAGSDLLPAGFTQRLRALADAVRAAAPAAARLGGGDTGPGEVAAVAAAQRCLHHLEQHRAPDHTRLEAARMAVRLLRWLASPDPGAPATLLDAVHRQVHGNGWVDRARLDIFAGDPDPQVAQAYGLLHHATDARRGRHDQQFATLLAADTAADAPAGALLRVEDLLARIVRPIAEHHRVLLLVLDGMSVAAATELAESLTRSGAWLELTPGGGPRIGVLAALPSVTEVSRCSLFSGRIGVGQQKQEREAFAKQFPEAVLLHKAALRATAGAALDPDVVAALNDPFTRVVAAVINTIDDALDRSDPGTVVWGAENIRSVRDLLAHAQDRVVVLVSDHGHVVDRGPDAVTLPSPSSENRWRPASTPPGDGEMMFTGPRVALGGGQVVLPWREEVRYGPRKAGYHGGACAAEVVIPLITLATSEEAAGPDWSGAPVASPAWWRETLPDTAAASATPAILPPDRRRTTRQTQEETLFDVAPAAPIPAQAVLPGAASPVGATPVQARPPLVEALLASEIYRQRRGTRAPLPDERVAAMLGVLLAGGGRATLDTLAVHAAVPAHRIGGTITALRKLLQVEGYPVLDLDPDGQTVKLDTVLLAEQFHLETP